MASTQPAQGRSLQMARATDPISLKEVDQTHERLGKAMPSEDAIANTLSARFSVPKEEARKALDEVGGHGGRAAKELARKTSASSQQGGMPWALPRAEPVIAATDDTLTGTWELDFKRSTFGNGFGTITAWEGTFTLHENGASIATGVQGPCRQWEAEPAVQLGRTDALEINCVLTVKICFGCVTAQYGGRFVLIKDVKDDGKFCPQRNELWDHFPSIQGPDSSSGLKVHEAGKSVCWWGKARDTEPEKRLYLFKAPRVLSRSLIFWT